MSAKKEQPVAWVQVSSLGFLATSVVIGWIAYNQFQPILLENYNLQHLEGLLVISQATILFFTPPIAGAIADKFRKNSNKILPLLASGVSFAAMVFMTTAFTLFAGLSGIIHWLLPVLILLWLISMNIFTSPAVASFELLAPVKKFPQVMAVLTIIVELLYSLEPVIVDIINFIGAPATFAAGGIVVLMAGLIFKRKTVNNPKKFNNPQPTGTGNLLAIFFIGLGLGIPTAMIFNIFPDLLSQKFSSWEAIGFSGESMVSILLVISALCCYPISKKLNPSNFFAVFLASFIITVVLSIIMLNSDQKLILAPAALLFIVTFSALSVSSLPWALEMTGAKNKIFAVGIFFAAIELPDSLIEIWGII